MNVTVANVTECEELYRLSGWKGQYWWWSWREYEDKSGHYVLVGEHEAPFQGSTYPAYDVGYLLKMLPAVTLMKQGNGNYDTTWQDYINDTRLDRSSRTNPANALCRLAIALFEAGVLLPANA